MNYKRIIAAALIALPAPLTSLLSSGAMAETYLVLTQASGVVSRFALTDSPVVTFADGCLVVTCGETTLTTSMTGLRSSFEDVSTAISSPTAGKATGGDAPTFSFAHSAFEGLKAGDTVDIYTLDGRKAGSAKADGEGRAAIDLTPLGRGVYILQTPTIRIKIKH